MTLNTIISNLIVRIDRIRRIKIFIIQILLLGAISGSAKKVELNFIVLDSQSNPISDAFVLLSSDSISGHTLGSTISDTQGRAIMIIELSQTYLFVQVQQLSYHPYYEVVEIQDATDRIVIEILLRPKTYSLQEAKVSARREYSEISNNDTLRLDINSRRDSTEKSIMELLSKAPGMRLLPDGRLKYQGRDISRVKIDNKDIFGQNGFSKPLTQLSPDMVGNVDVIKNNHEDPVLNRLEQSNETILNITTDSSIPRKVVGEVASIIGANQEKNFSYDLNSNVLLLNSKNGIYGQILHSNYGKFIDDVNYNKFTDLTTNSINPLDDYGKLLVSIPVGYSSLDQFQVTPQLIADASITEGAFSWIHQTAEGSSYRLQVKLGEASDNIYDKTIVSLIDNYQTFSLGTENSQSVSRQGGLIEFDHRGVTSTPLISYRINANLKGNVLNSDFTINQLDGVTSSASFFPVRSDIGSVVGNVGVRLNIATGKTSALQLFGIKSFGEQSQYLELDLDSNLIEIVSDFGQIQTSSFSQKQRIISNQFKSGLKYLYKSQVGLGELYLDHTRTTRLATLDFRDTFDTSGNTSMTIVRTGGKLTSKVFNNWVLGSKTQFLISQISSSHINRWRPDYSYFVFLRQKRGPLENYVLQFNKSVNFASLPHLPGAFLIQDPFSAYQQEYQISPSISERVSVIGRQKLFDGDVFFNGKINYLWRIKEGQNQLQLEDDSQFQRQNVIFNGQSLSSSVFIENTSLKYGYTLKIIGQIDRSIFESNLVGFTEKRSVTFYAYGVDIQLPRIGDFYTSINAMNEQTIVTGAFTSKSQGYAVKANLKYKRRNWLAQVNGKLKLASATSISLFVSLRPPTPLFPDLWVLTSSYVAVTRLAFS